MLPGCSSQTIYPGTSSGTTCSPTTAFGTLSTIPISANYPSISALPTGVVEYAPLAITNSQASATPANFQQMVTIDSASFTQYEASNLQNVEFFTGTGTILASWLESGNLNTAASTVYWINLGANTIATGGTLTIYMGFGSPTTSDFFTNATGQVGEAPMLSPTYAEYDNGAVVFSTYFDFAGTSLPTGWSSISGRGDT